MKILKNRVLRIKMRGKRAEEIEQLLQSVDTNAYILWIGYDLFNLVQTAYFQNIRLCDTYGDYTTEMVVRCDHLTETLTIFFTKSCKNVH